MNNAAPFATVLLVDDSTEILELTELVLARAGFHVIRASCEAEALREWNGASGGIDVLVTDIKLGKCGSGLDLAERLLCLKPSLKVLAISGFLAPDELNGMGSKVAFLQKPFALSDVPTRVQALLDSPAAIGQA